MSKKTNLKSWLIIPVLLLLIPESAFAGQIIYVDADATGSDTGTSWANAYVYLQDALSDANASAKPVEIRVAQSTYKPDEGIAVEDANRTDTFQLINDVTLKGSYAGYNEPDPNARNIEIYETILSGDLDGNDVGDLEDPSREENSYHVVNGSGTDANAILDGFTITRGHADGSDATNCGGGIYINEGSPTIINCFISRNSAIVGYLHGNGGGIYCSESSPTITNCTITDNLAGSEGGGIYNCSGPINNCIISNNSVVAGRGGGLCYCDGPITNCTITDNGAGQGGGLSYCNGVINNCSITNNWAYQGGGMHDCDGQIKNCSISKNIGLICGGGLEDCDGLIINCVISGNRGESFEMSMGGSRGGGLYHCNGQINNCTITGNSFVYNGGGLYLCDGVISNCIIWNNDANENSQMSNSSDPIYSCIENWSGGGIGNINDDPCFVDTGYWDDNGTPEDVEDDFWVKGDFHLKSQAGRWNPNSKSWVIDVVTSPCIDAGDMSSSISYEPFPNGGRINMGAYGGTAQASKSYFGTLPCETIVAGDINGDCKVNFLDFAIMTGHWLWEE